MASKKRTQSFSSLRGGGVNHRFYSRYENTDLLHNFSKQRQSDSLGVKMSIFLPDSISEDDSHRWDGIVIYANDVYCHTWHVATRLVPKQSFFIELHTVFLSIKTAKILLLVTEFEKKHLSLGHINFLLWNKTLTDGYYRTRCQTANPKTNPILYFC